MTVTKKSIIGDVLDACAVHGTDADELVAKINAYLADKK